MKKFLFVAGIAFAVTLAVMMGARMSSDALAVVIGIICGVLASIPTSAMLVWVMRQRDKLEAQMGQGRSYGQYPPVVVVNGQHPPGYPTPPGPPALPAGPTPTSVRNFKVIGQESTETTGDSISPFWDEL